MGGINRHKAHRGGMAIDPVKERDASGVLYA